MLKYPCLVLDHDDTVVQSESTVNYPAFLKALDALRPGQTISLEDFSLWTFREGFSGMCTRHFHCTEEHSARLSNSFWPAPRLHLWMGAGTRKAQARPLSLGSDYESLQLKSYRAFGGRRYEIRLRYGKNSERPLRLGWMGTSGDTGNFRFYETVLRLFLCNPDRIGAIFILKGNV